MKSSTPRLLRSTALATTLLCGNAFAQSDRPKAAPPSAVDERAQAARDWAFWGLVGPALAGAAFSMVVQPGGKQDPPDWQIGVLAGLFGGAATWGTSAGYYRGGMPLYATAAGIGKTALLAGGILLDRRMAGGGDERRGHGMPLLTLLALAGVVAWDGFDLATVKERTRAHHGARPLALAPLAGPLRGGGIVGVAGRF